MHSVETEGFVAAAARPAERISRIEPDVVEVAERRRIAGGDQRRQCGGLGRHGSSYDGRCSDHLLSWPALSFGRSDDVVVPGPRVSARRICWSLSMLPSTCRTSSIRSGSPWTNSRPESAWKRMTGGSIIPCAPDSIAVRIVAGLIAI